MKHSMFGMALLVAAVLSQRYVTLPFVHSIAPDDGKKFYKVTVLMLVLTPSNKMFQPAEKSEQGYLAWLKDTSWKRVHSYGKTFSFGSKMINAEGAVDFKLTDATGDKVQHVVKTGASPVVNVEGVLVNFDRTGAGVGFFHNAELGEKDVNPELKKDSYTWVIIDTKQTTYDDLLYTPFKCKELASGATDTFQIKETRTTAKDSLVTLSHTKTPAEVPKTFELETNGMRTTSFAVVNVSGLPLALFSQIDSPTIDMSWTTKFDLSMGIPTLVPLVDESRLFKKNLIHNYFGIRLYCDQGII